MDSILKDLAQRNVFSVDISMDKTVAVFYEECDNYYKATYTKPQVQQLINELQSLHDQMVD